MEKKTMPDRKIVRLLYRSFDEKLPDKKQKVLNNALAASKELRQESLELKRLRTQLALSGKVSFGPYFTERVIAHVEAKEYVWDFSSSLIAAFKPLAIAGVIALALLAPLNLRSFNLHLSGKHSVEKIIEQVHILYIEELL